MKYLFPIVLLCGCAGARHQPAAPLVAAPPATVVLRGSVANAGFRDTVRVFYHPVPGQSASVVVKAPVSAAGTFELKTAPLAGPVDAQFSCGGFETIFLSPGDSQVVSFDRRELLGTIRFTGRGAPANTYLTRAQRAFDFDF